VNFTKVFADLVNKLREDRNQRQARPFIADAFHQVLKQSQFDQFRTTLEHPDDYAAVFKIMVTHHDQLQWIDRGN
jgi:hypothetical protein